MSKQHLSVLQDADLKGKIVLVRVDHNVVKKGVIHDPYRIDASLSTLFHINSKGGKIILMTHVGRPKDKKTGDITIDDETSVKPIMEYLKNKLQLNFKTPEFKQNGNKGYAGIDDSINPLIEELKSDKIEGIYLPNTRWFEGEEANDESADKLAKDLASIADIYVNDAFGSWQPHTSTVRVNKYLPSYAGLLMQKEIENLGGVFEPKKPLLAVVAGSKFDTKIASLNSLLERADNLVLGGVIYNAYLCAKYNFKIKGISEEDMTIAKKFVDFAEQYPGKLVELPYIVESDILNGKIQGKHRTHYIHDIKPGTKLNFVLDIDPKSFEEKSVRKIFLCAKTIFVNAVMGFTPNFNVGTIAMDILIDNNKHANKLFGGGDTLQEFKRLLPGTYMNALTDSKYYMFTGGGAILKAIQEGTTTGMEPVKVLCK